MAVVAGYDAGSWHGVLATTGSTPEQLGACIHLGIAKRADVIRVAGTTVNWLSRGHYFSGAPVWSLRQMDGARLPSNSKPANSTPEYRNTVLKAA